MIDPHLGEECSLAIEEIALLDSSDASADFGVGAIVVSCRCGSWAIEDEDGVLVAWSSKVAVVELRRELSGAA